MGAKGTGLEPLGNCFHFILGPRSQWEATERHWEKFLNSCYGEFPGGLVVRIPGFLSLLWLISVPGQETDPARHMA